MIEMTFIGIKVYGGTTNRISKSNNIIHINTDFIRYLDEKEMKLYLDDGTNFRIDEESLEVFLYAVYGEIKED
jgi:hypothetical protein